jgi:hypothetical protein
MEAIKLVPFPNLGNAQPLPLGSEITSSLGKGSLGLSCMGRVKL